MCFDWTEIGFKLMCALIGFKLMCDCFLLTVPEYYQSERLVIAFFTCRFSLKVYSLCTDNVDIGA